MKASNSYFSTKNILNGIAFYQMTGGLLGLGLFTKLPPQLHNPSGSTWLGIGLAAALYLFSVVCGFQLLRRKPQAVNWSMVNQGLQVLSLGVAGFAYNYVAGLKLGVGLDFLASWVFKVRISVSSFQFMLQADGAPSFVGINLLALLLLYFLEKSKDSI
ncbi:hypothetical protein [Rufibacter sp. LB8]|uniref:hypothetical protein n=1 Tax=Rufibacter sp. LB8 TaxID=2777781 RepID=UPI00178C6549|nr:hypothetical protein [Rufibacter sp. LB8]